MPGLQQRDSHTDSKDRHTDNSKTSQQTTKPSLAVIMGSKTVERTCQCQCVELTGTTGTRYVQLRIGGTRSYHWQQLWPG
jgi:hypothetical protein